MSDGKHVWTLEAYVSHNEALREAEAKFQSERDRRYAEVKSAEEKALRVKEQADRDALGLAREIQTYKDEKANELREQIASERGIYATKDELVSAVREISLSIKPMSDHMASQAGSGSGRREMIAWIISAIMLAITLWPHIK